MYKKLEEKSLINQDVIIGFFDVLHKGHLKLFSATNISQTTILTFKSIPRKQSLNDFQTRISNLVNLGFKDVFVFDIEQNNMTANEFVEKYLVNSSKIIVGSDFIFGSDFKSIKQFKDQLNLILMDYDENYSTTKVKDLLKEGSVSKVNELLISPFCIESIVVSGNKLGKTINFPTANFNFDNELFLKHGVYLTKTIIDGISYKSLTIYGKPNSIKVTKIPLMETHILNFDKDIYGDRIKVVFFDYIEQLQKFNSKEELIKQINKFVDIAKNTQY